MTSHLPTLPGLRGHRTREFALPGGAVLRVQLLSFAVDDFAPMAFAQAGMALPESIRRSMPKRQAEFFFGRLAARLALADVGLPACEVPIGPGRAPVWPTGCVGSITHHDTLAVAAAIARGSHGLGIDVERIVDEGESAEALRAVAFDSQELALIGDEAATGIAPLHALTLAFSAKESFFKASHALVGRHFGFEVLCLQGIDASERRLAFTLRESLHEALPRDRRIDVAFEFLRSESVLTGLAF